MNCSVWKMEKHDMTSGHWLLAFNFGSPGSLIWSPSLPQLPPEWISWKCQQKPSQCEVHTLEPLRPSSGLIEIHFKVTTQHLQILRFELGNVQFHLPFGLSRLQLHNFALASTALWTLVLYFCKNCRCLFVVFTLFYVGFKSYQGCFNLPVQLPIIGQFFLWSSGRAQLGTEGLQCHG